MEMEVPSSCNEIKKHLTNVSWAIYVHCVITEYKQNGSTNVVQQVADNANIKLKSINVGKFNNTEDDPIPVTGKKGQVYITIALTPLGSNNGWFEFLEGSHKRNSTDPITKWKRAALTLEAGDAVVWRGDLVYLHSSGGGASFMTMIFE